ncbi:unnamed protein product [Schistosoma guineensis]|nr:unnamed protein product [Schistosoma guineensis]
MAKFRSAVDKEKPGVIAVSETWLTSEVLDNEIQLTGFLPTRADRLNPREGGLILYPTMYDLRNSSLDLVFTHSDDVGQMTSLLPLGRSDHAVILFKFMAEIAYQTVAPARPNVWKADLEAINSAAST